MPRKRRHEYSFERREREARKRQDRMRKEARLTRGPSTGTQPSAEQIRRIAMQSAAARGGGTPQPAPTEMRLARIGVGWFPRITMEAWKLLLNLRGNPTVGKFVYAIDYSTDSAGERMSKAGERIVFEVLTVHGLTGPAGKSKGYFEINAKDRTIKRVAAPGAGPGVDWQL